MPKLVHFVMLGAKVGVFDTELRAQLGGAPETRDGLRRQLPSNIFVQFLAGPGDIRKGGLGWLLKLIAWFSLVIGPVLLLLLIQVQFLPYHLEWVTWVQLISRNKSGKRPTSTENLSAPLWLVR